MCENIEINSMNRVRANTKNTLFCSAILNKYMNTIHETYISLLIPKCPKDYLVGFRPTKNTK